MNVARALKVATARALCCAPVASVLDRVFHADVPAHGMRFHMPVGVVAPETRAALFFRLYERAEISFVRAHLRRDLDVVELGSSAGVVAAILAARQDVGRRLVCVEANPDLIDVVRTNLARSNPQRDVAVVHGAISYDVPEGASVALGIGATSVASRIGGPSGRTVEVPAVRLGGLLEQHGIGAHALVCDIEGAEAGIVLDDPEPLQRCEQVVIELHDAEYRGCRVEVGELAGALVRRHGFRRVASRGPVYAFSR